MKSAFSSLPRSQVIKRIRRAVIITGALLVLGAASNTSTPIIGAFAPQTAFAAEQSVAQSNLWEGQGDTWRVRAANGNGYLRNSWFQDNDGSWYMLGGGANCDEMYSGIVTDQSTGKSYYLNTNHDGHFGAMVTQDGVYQVNGRSVYLTFNQNHDGAFGAITSGLSELQQTGVQSKSLASIPTGSASAGSTGSGFETNRTNNSGGGIEINRTNTPAVTGTRRSIDDIKSCGKGSVGDLGHCPLKF